MIEICDEIPFSGKNGRNFEAYMYATTEKHIQRHESFSDMELLVMYNKQIRQLSGDALENRKAMLSFF